jgi:hypothetical protein
MQVSGKIYGKPMETPIFLARCPADFTVYDESPAVSRPQCPSAAMSRDRTRSPHGTWEQNRKKNDLPIENIIILHSKLWKYQESFILYIYIIKYILIFWFISMGHLFGKVLDLSERRLVFT